MGFFMFKNKLIIFGAVFFCFAMVVFPEITASASTAAMNLWLNAIVPTLFPFVIMVNFIQQTGILYRIPQSIYPFIMAFLSGYPMGARTAGDAYRCGSISGEDLRHILSFSMITGPAFIIGAVGTGFFHSAVLGYILAAGHYGGALINGLLYGGLPLKRKRSFSPLPQPEVSYSSGFTDAVLDGFKTTGIILAYIMMFMIVTDILQFSGAFSWMKQDYTEAVMKGILEMTVGCNGLQSCQCGIRTKLILTSFLISFGGFSVIGQSMSMLRSCPVTLMQLIKIKLTHGIISGILTFTICAFVV